MHATTRLPPLSRVSLQLRQTAMAALAEDRRRLLDDSWTHAALLYLQELVPRFCPWLFDAVRVLLDARADLPPCGQPILLPCCGPGHEIPVVYRCLSGTHPVLGSDLARGMVQLSREVIQAELAGRLYTPRAADDANTAAPCVSTGPVSAVERAVSHVLEAAAQQLGHTHLTPVLGSTFSTGQPAAGMDAQVLDACLLDQQHTGSAAGVLSVFGLQQLGPLAPQALSSWIRCLAPGGLAVVVMWPSHVETQGGPWEAYGQVLAEQLAAQRASATLPSPESDKQQQGKQQQGKQQQQGQQQQSGADTWEAQLVPAALQVPDCRLVSDALISHTMTWQDAETFWKVMTEGGPWHARRLMSGDVFMDQLKQRWLRKLDGRHVNQSGQLTHRPQARMLVFRRLKHTGSHVAQPAAAGVAAARM